ncbi:hypothetical protein AB0F24_17455 [Streptomyces platensis]
MTTITSTAPAMSAADIAAHEAASYVRPRPIPRPRPASDARTAPKAVAR